MNRITIKFLVDYTPYKTGEIATFFEREANRLIDRGFAMKYVAPGQPADSAAEKLKALSNTSTRSIPAAPETKVIPGPEKTKAPEGPKDPEKVEAPQSPINGGNAQTDEGSGQAPKVASKVEGKAKNKGRGRQSGKNKGKKQA
ncbi:MAG TPA: hypothetical protein PKG74_00420 [Candidatus Colwellbacteria bacterium]|nr:hypothetical protein [Candidatus Colwellbacteria bacterium]